MKITYCMLERLTVSDRCYGSVKVIKTSDGFAKRQRALPRWISGHGVQRVMGNSPFYFNLNISGSQTVARRLFQMVLGHETISILYCVDECNRLNRKQHLMCRLILWALGTKRIDERWWNRNYVISHTKNSRLFLLLAGWAEELTKDVSFLSLGGGQGLPVSHVRQITVWTVGPLHEALVFIYRFLRKSAGWNNKFTVLKNFT